MPSFPYRTCLPKAPSSSFRDITVVPNSISPHRVEVVSGDLMAATKMATAAGAVVLVYYDLSRRLTAKEEDEVGEEYSKSPGCRFIKRRLSRRQAQAPATWLETISTLAETLRFTYSETLGKWPIRDLAFGINYLIRRQGNLRVASVYAGDNCLQLKGDDIIEQLYTCMLIWRLLWRPSYCK